MVEIECITREDGLRNLRREWEELWQSSLTASFFLTFSWICCCWKELQAHNELRVFVARDEGRAVLVAPFMKSRRAQKGLPVDCLTFIEHPEAQIADILLARSQQSSRALEALLKFLVNVQVADWHLLSLDKIPQGSPTLELLAASAESCSSRFEVKSSHEALFIPLVGDWQAYLNTRSPRFRKTLRNVVNRIERLGAVEVKCYSGQEVNDQTIEKLFSVSDSSWKVADGVAITSQTHRMRFFEDLLLAVAQRGDVRVWMLEVNGAAIASEIQVIDGPTVYALRSDYDERYADSSPGMYLQVEILQQLFRSSYESYNLGVGLNPYKTRWADQRLPVMNFRIYNQTMYSRLLRSVDQYDLGKLKRVPGIRSLHDFIVGRVS
jgi:CelD/BcsL family acetyltransferase involved in cellulose biosynthesis